MPPGAIVSITQGKIDIALSQFARQYRNNMLIAEMLFPRVEVTNQSDLFWTFGRENQKLAENTLRGPGSPAERIKQTISTTRYAAVDHSLARLIPDEERANFQAGDVEQWATKAIQDKLLLDLENIIATLAADTTKYASGYTNTLSGTSQWSDYVNSTPLKDVEVAKALVRKSGNAPNVLILGDPVFQQLINHPTIIDRFKYTKPGNIGVAELASVFGIEKVVLGSAVAVDVNDVAQFVWGKHAIVAYVQPAASFEDVSFGKLFVWSGAPGTVAGFGVELGRVHPPSAKSDELAMHFYYDKVVTSNVSAYLLKNAVA